MKSYVMLCTLTHARSIVGKFATAAPLKGPEAGTGIYTQKKGMRQQRVTPHCLVGYLGSKNMDQNGVIFQSQEVPSPPAL